MLNVLAEKDFKAVFEIMQNSFPLDEYRPFKEQLELLSRKDYKVYVHKNNAQVAAFFAVWHFNGFAFLEHFAVQENYRSRGVGSGLLQELLLLLNKPIVLEVELPQTVLAEKRIHFYEKNGFFQNDYAYIQPAIAEGRKAIPLMLMSYPKRLNVTEYQKAKNQLYQQVYRFPQ